MKTRLQFSPTMIAAATCALLWFAVWLVPFRPIPLQQNPEPLRTAAGFMPAADKMVRDYQSPTLFALPAEQGFSGTFPESRINLLVPSAETDVGNTLPESRISSESESNREQFFLSREPAEREVPDQISLQEAIPSLKSVLPMPSEHSETAVPQPDRITFFLSPELQMRADDSLHLAVSGDLPRSVRIHLLVQPDGTVKQAVFETPVENNELAGAIRRLRFKPAPLATAGWLELRFPTGGHS